MEDYGERFCLFGGRLENRLFLKIVYVFVVDELVRGRGGE